MHAHTVETLVAHFPDRQGHIEASLLSSLDDAKYTQLLDRQAPRGQDAQRYAKFLEVLRGRHWLFRFQNLRPLIYPGVPECENWEQLVIYYYFLLKDVIRVRYVLKKMGQGWSTIILFLTGPDTFHEPPSVDATMFQKQSYTLDLIEQLKLAPDQRLPDGPARDVSVAYIEEITRHSSFREYKDSIANKVHHALNLTEQEEQLPADAPDSDLDDPSPRLPEERALQIFKRGPRKPGRPPKEPSATPIPSDELIRSEEDYYSVFKGPPPDLALNKRESDRLLKERRSSSPPKSINSFQDRHLADRGRPAGGLNGAASGLLPSAPTTTLNDEELK